MPPSLFRRTQLFLSGALVAIMTLVTASPVVQAQESLRIAAIVNDDVISGYDLFIRMRLVMGLSRIPDTPETRKRLMPQVLRRLIDERLQVQETKRLEITAPEPAVQATIGSVETSNGVPSGQIDDFLKSLGVPKSVLITEVETRIAWERAIGRLYGPRVDIGEDDITEALAEIRANTGKPEYLVSEIFLPVERPGLHDQVMELARRILEQIRGGTPFSALANNFSQNPTAATGGDLGWVQPQQLEPELGTAIKQMQPRTLPQIIDTISGVYILGLRDKRISQGPVDPSASVNLQQLFFPLPQNPDMAVFNSVKASAENFRARSTSCQAMESMKGATNNPVSGNMGDLKLGGLAPPIQEALKGLPVGQPSSIIRLPTGLSILMICSRSQDDDAETIIRNQIRQQLTEERLQNAAKRHLRELRRSAFIDVRL